MRTWFWGGIAVFLVASSALAANGGATSTFDEPIDALSVGFSSSDDALEVRAQIEGAWTPWTVLALENEQDPSLRESNLVLFPAPTTRIEIRGNTAIYTLHPIRVSHKPAQILVAAASGDTATPRILTRKEWGADESLGIVGRTPPPPPTEQNPASPQDNGTPVPARVQECEEEQRLYPQEFKTTKKKVTKDADGKKLRWTRTYSPDIKLLVVHHTAVKVSGDARSGAERMRALYAYHSMNRGWGDIGYHYVIDDDGQIYQGRAGGPSVVGGHVYCNNVGTIGVSLMGNFEIEEPTQAQMKSLQWLLSTLAEQYKIDLGGTVRFHGKTLPTIVGHRQLVSTDCPGYYVAETLDQVRQHVRSDDLLASINFPPPRQQTTDIVQKAAERRLEREARNPISRRMATLSRKIRTYARLGATSRFAARIQSTPPSTAPAQSNRRVQKASTRKSSSSSPSSASLIRIRLTSQEQGETTCDAIDLDTLRLKYRGSIECFFVEGKVAIINTLPLEEYLWGLREEPDGEPYEKQRAFAIAARTYARYWMEHQKFPGMPYDGTDSPANFQTYDGIEFEKKNPEWMKAVRSTSNQILLKDDQVIRAAYFAADPGVTRSPQEAGWTNFPFSEVFAPKPDPWCNGMKLSGHGVGMSGCGAGGQAREGKTAEEILRYYYPGTSLR
jgi:peptidoglycan hydrolase-like amidase